MAGIEGSHLKRLRQLAGYGATAFAKELGISLTYLGDIESGKRTLKRNPELIKRAADLLGVPVPMIERRSESDAAA